MNETDNMNASPASPRTSRLAMPSAAVTGVLVGLVGAILLMAGISLASYGSPVGQSLGIVATVLLAMAIGTLFWKLSVALATNRHGIDRITTAWKDGETSAWGIALLGWFVVAIVTLLGSGRGGPPSTAGPMPIGQTGIWAGIAVGAVFSLLSLRMRGQAWATMDAARRRSALALAKRELVAGALVAAILIADLSSPRHRAAYASALEANRQPLSVLLICVLMYVVAFAVQTFRSWRDPS